ncbi:MAG: wax ester/triacylglycerol synthase family O-acyltransferase [Caldilineales bacterium]
MSEDLSNVDVAWYHMELPNNLMMISGVFVFGQMLAFDRVKATLEERLLIFDRFRQRVVEPRFGIGSPRWEFDPQFDIANHVHRIALPAPGDQAALQDLMSDMMATPLDYSKPLWQFHLVEGYGEGCALVCRLHHCIADGIALMRVLLSLTDDTPDAHWSPPVEDEEERQRSRNPFRLVTRPASAAFGATRRFTGSVWGEGKELISNPSYALDLARQGTDTTMALGRLLLMLPDRKTIFKGPLGVPKRAAWSTPIPLPTVKAVGRATGATVNDVLLACVAGALRSYLLTHAQPVEGLNIRAVIPVNLRPPDAAIELGNRFGLIFLALPVGIEDSFDRLMELKRRMDELKGTPEAVVAFGILNAIGMAPTDIENLIVDIFGTKATAVMTNVPGPRHQVYFAGGPITQLMFWVPQSGRLGIGVSILSYNDQVLLGLATDQGLIPDPDTIIAFFHEEINALVALVEQVQPGEVETPVVTLDRAGD